MTDPRARAVYRRAPLGLLAAVLLAVAGCGGDRSPAGEAGGPGDAADTSGLPRWRAVLDAAPAEHHELVLRCEAPIRTRFRVETTEGPPWVGPWRDLRRGQTQAIHWTVAARETDAESPDAEDVSAGRTQAFEMLLTVRYADARVDVFHYVLGTRPGRGAGLTLAASPPGTYAALPDTDPRPGHARLELATAVVTDLPPDTGTARLRAGDGRHRLLLPALSAGAEARVHEARLFLEVAPPAAASPGAR